MEIWKCFKVIFESQILLKEVNKNENSRNLETPVAKVLWVINSFGTSSKFCHILNHPFSLRFHPPPPARDMMMFIIWRFFLGNFSVRKFDLSHNRLSCFLDTPKCIEYEFSSISGLLHVYNSLLSSLWQLTINKVCLIAIYNKLREETIKKRQY